MFGIGGTELLLIALAVLLLFGPERLPEFARKAGRVYADFKRYTATMESVIRAEIDLGEKDSDADAAASKDAAEAKERSLAAPDAFEDDEDEEEEG